MKVWKPMVWQVSRLRVAAAAAALTCPILAGCGAGSSMLDNMAATSEPAVARAVAAKPLLRTVTYRPPQGPPEDVTAELTRQLVEAGAEEGIALVVDTSVPTDVSLRGYLTSMRKGSTANISYLWDVVDARGQRVHRVSGEQTVASADAKQPWSAVTPAVARSIAQRTIGDLATWARATARPQAAATPAPAQSRAPSAAAFPAERGNADTTTPGLAQP